MVLATLAIAALGGFLWFAFTFAVYAMPACVGIYAGTKAYHSGAGVIGAIIVGLVVAGLVLGLGEFAFSRLRSIWARALLALAYAGPATYAGYHATNGIVKYLMPSESWQIAFSVVGAIVAGFVSFARLASTPHVPSEASPGSSAFRWSRWLRGGADPIAAAAPSGWWLGARPGSSSPVEIVGAASGFRTAGQPSRSRPRRKWSGQRCWACRKQRGSARLTRNLAL